MGHSGTISNSLGLKMYLDATGLLGTLWDILNDLDTLGLFKLSGHFGTF